MAIAAQSPGAVSRNRFMLGVLGGISTVIGVVYLGAILRYLYPKSSGEPPLKVTIGPDGVTPPGGATMSFANGVAGPFTFPTVTDGSVVVGMFVEKINATGPLTADNLRMVEQTCTHLGCPVAWVPSPTAPTETAGRFECPCHGSQFHRNLTVAHGPAEDPLHEHSFTLSGDTLTIMGRK